VNSQLRLTMLSPASNQTTQVPNVAGEPTAMPTTELKRVIQKVAAGATLDAAEIAGALEIMAAGHATPAQMGAFLMAMRVRGETVEEITGAARFMRSRMKRVMAPAGAVDIVGTGGDSHGTYNVSTCASLVAAGAGLPIAKHGNRSVSSISGASDVLAALGVKLDVGPAVIERSIAEAGVGFMWAPMHHDAMKHWAPIRAELGIRTIFNLLGPICNPAGVKRQVVGVYARQWVEPVAHVLQQLGAEHVWVVHGHDGLDELTTTGATDIAELKDGQIRLLEVTPADAGLLPAKLSDLKGGDATANARAICAVLAGQAGPFRNIVLLNAAAALIVGGHCETLEHGVSRAAQSIDSGAAAAALAKLVAVTNAAPHA
jgi:anthranilate phosphoribosyltransferase